MRTIGKDKELTRQLEQMREDARETEERGTRSAGDLEGKKTAVLDKARETEAGAAEMMSTYHGSDAEGLDGFEFLTMAQAAEVGHWSVLRKLNERAGDERLAKLIEWALPIQETTSSRSKRARSTWPGKRIPGKRRNQAPVSPIERKRNDRGT